MRHTPANAYVRKIAYLAFNFNSIFFIIVIIKRQNKKLNHNELRNTFLPIVHRLSSFLSLFLVIAMPSSKVCNFFFPLLSYTIYEKIMQLRLIFSPPFRMFHQGRKAKSNLSPYRCIKKCCKTA